MTDSDSQPKFDYTPVPDVIAAAQARGQARDLDATVVELLAELAELEGYKG